MAAFQFRQFAPRATGALAIGLLGAYVLLGLLAIGASAFTPWMAEEELKATFSGQSIDGHYPSGRTFRETFAEGGRVAYEDERRRSAGDWSIQAGTFCTIYDDDPTGGCFLVRRMSDNCFEFYFVSRTKAGASRPGAPAWTAQAWLSSKPSTCVSGAEV